MPEFLDAVDGDEWPLDVGVSVHMRAAGGSHIAAHVKFNWMVRGAGGPGAAPLPLRASQNSF